MKACAICRETTNLYRPVGQAAWYCHTCLATGRVDMRERIKEAG